MEDARGPKACMQCAHAKVKCDGREADGLCKRCRRLKKQCTSQASGARRRKVPYQKTDVSRLEQKVDGMAALLASQQRLEKPDDILSSHLPIGDEAESALNTYRSETTQALPFIVIAPNVQASVLRKEKPLLYAAISMATFCQATDAQARLAKAIREYLGEHLLLQGDKDLGLFQGLLLYAAYYHVHHRFGTILTNLLHLVLAMMIDLGLHKRRTSTNNNDIANSLTGEDTNRVRRTLEERRAYLGSFYLTQVASVCIQDIEPLRSSKYTEECLQALDEAKEFPTDLYLVHLVKLVRFADRINRTLTWDELDPTSFSSAPVAMCIAALEADIERQYTASLSALEGTASAPGSWCERSLLLHYCTIRLFLYDNSLTESDWSDSVYYDPYPHRNLRLSMVYKAVEMLNLFFRSMDLLEKDLYMNPYPIWAQFAHAVVDLGKLSLLDSTALPGWDESLLAHRGLEFASVIDRFVRNVEEASMDTQPGHSEHRKVWSDMAIARVKFLKEILGSRKKRKDQHHVLAGQSQGIQPNGIEMDTMLQDATTSVGRFADAGNGMPAVSDRQFQTLPSYDLNAFEFLDEAFWQQLM